MLSSDKTKTVFLVNGFLPIAEINAPELGFDFPRNIYSHYDGRIRMVVGEQKESQTELWLLECEAGVIEEWK